MIGIHYIGSVNKQANKQKTTVKDVIKKKKKTQPHTIRYIEVAIPLLTFPHFSHISRTYLAKHNINNE